MCLICGVPYCNCTPVKLPPCNPCQEDSGCNPKIEDKCVTINNMTVKDYFGSNVFLDLLYNELVANDALRAQFCALWTACSTLCAAPTNLSIAANPATANSVIITWTVVGGNTYDLYIDGILTTVGATSPITRTGLTPEQEYEIRILTHCPNTATAFTDITFTLCPPATDFAVNEGLSNANNILVEWTEEINVVYDLYLNGVLKQVAATSPYVYTGLTADTLYTLKIVSRCPAGIQNFHEITFTTPL